MRRAAYLLAGIAVSVGAGVVSVRAEELTQVRHVAVPFNNSGKRPPAWSGGALLVVDNADRAAPVLSTFGRDGALVARMPFSIREASGILIRAFKRASNGSVALVGSAYTADSRSATFLAVLSSDGLHSQITRLSPFYPYDVAIAADGSYWVAGEGPDGNVIRRFDSAGSELGAWIPRSGLQPYRYGDPAEDSFLVSSNDRIGWYSNVAREYIEFSLGGAVLLRLPGLALEEPARVDGAGLCDDGRLYVSVYPVSRDERRSELFTLDRGSGTWRLVPVPAAGSDSERYRPVYGCDGSDLVMRARRSSETLGIGWLRLAGAR